MIDFWPHFQATAVDRNLTCSKKVWASSEWLTALAGETLELLLASPNQDEVGEEVCDVLSYIALTADSYDIDLSTSFRAFGSEVLFRPNQTEILESLEEVLSIGKELIRIHRGFVGGKGATKENLFVGMSMELDTLAHLVYWFGRSHGFTAEGLDSAIVAKFNKVSEKLGVGHFRLNAPPPPKVGDRLSHASNSSTFLVDSVYPMGDDYRLYGTLSWPAKQGYPGIESVIGIYWSDQQSKWSIES